MTCLAKLDGKAVRFVLSCKSNYLGLCTIEKLLNLSYFQCEVFLLILFRKLRVLPDNYLNINKAAFWANNKYKYRVVVLVGVDLFLFSLLSILYWLYQICKFCMFM